MDNKLNSMNNRDFKDICKIENYKFKYSENPKLVYLYILGKVIKNN